MDASKIISISRKQTSTSTGQISDVNYLDYLNIIYQETFSRVNMNDKKYTRQTYSTDIVASQREYNIPIADSTDTGLKKVLNLYISVS